MRTNQRVSDTFYDSGAPEILWGSCLIPRPKKGFEKKRVTTDE